MLPLPARPAGGGVLKPVVITADGLGLAPEVNDAVEAACNHGISTSASLMVAGPAAAHDRAGPRAIRSVGVQRRR
ncbi:MAG: ChbG/HpnK family deacetylase [Xanthobacteraceae bacterium]